MTEVSRPSDFIAYTRLMRNEPSSADVDLITTYCGLTLQNPIVAAASPASGTIEGVVALEAAGIGAIVLPSLFEELIEAEATANSRTFHFGSAYYSGVLAGHLPAVGHPDRSAKDIVAFVAESKKSVKVPIIASLNGVSLGGWTKYATEMQEAGADAIELNIYRVAANQYASAEEVENEYLEIVRLVRARVEIPLSVKIGPQFTSPGHFARRLAEAGADGLVLFNRFYQPNIDLDRVDLFPDLVLSTSAESRLVLRWMAIMHRRVNASLAATTGVHTADDVTRLILAGADVVMAASSLLENGPEHVSVLRDGLVQWLSRQGYSSVGEARGRLSQLHVANPEAFERSSYMETLDSYEPDVGSA